MRLRARASKKNLRKPLYCGIRQCFEFSFEADLVLLAMGFVHPIHEGLISSLGVKLTPAGNLDANETEYKTSIDKFFAAGDSRRGQSLVVWAIREGRQCARSIDQFLMGKSELPN